MDIIYLKEITSFNEALMNIYSENCSFDSSKAQIFIKYLIDFIKKSNETTIQGLTQNLQFFAELLTKSIQKNINLKSKTNLLFKSICEIFFAFLNKNYPKEIDINLIKKKLIDLGDEFLEYLSQTLEMIIGSSKKIIKNGAVKIFF